MDDENIKLIIEVAIWCGSGIIVISGLYYGIKYLVDKNSVRIDDLSKRADKQEEKHDKLEDKVDRNDKVVLNEFKDLREYIHKGQVASMKANAEILAAVNKKK